MSTPARPDDVRPLTAHERLCGEIIDALKTPYVCGYAEIDLEAVRALRRTLPSERAAALSDVVMVVTALARSLAADSRLLAVHHRGRRIVPADVDVGVSVAGRGVLSPVTVVRAAQCLSATQIADAIRSGARAALRGEKRDMERAWTARLVPGPLRRLLLRWALRSPRVRRNLVGTVQVSSVGTFGFEMATTPVAAAPLLMLGATQERPVARQGRVEVRARAWITLQGDHRVLDAAIFGALLTLVQDQLDRPDTLLEPPPGYPARSADASSSSAASTSAR